MGWKPIKRIIEPPDRSFFLFGARGTGKSTWLRQTFPTALTFDLLDTYLQLQLSVNPHASECLPLVTRGETVHVPAPCKGTNHDFSKTDHIHDHECFCISVIVDVVGNVVVGVGAGGF